MIFGHLRCPLNLHLELRLFAKFHTDEIDPKLAEKLLKDLLEREEQNAWTPEKIIKAMGSHYGIPTADLMGKSQMRETVLPRQVIMISSPLLFYFFLVSVCTMRRGV